jgi:hypothetical protein
VCEQVVVFFFFVCLIQVPHSSSPSPCRAGGTKNDAHYKLNRLLVQAAGASGSQRQPTKSARLAAASGRAWETAGAYGSQRGLSGLEGTNREPARANGTHGSQRKPAVETWASMILQRKGHRIFTFEHYLSPTYKIPILSSLNMLFLLASSVLYASSLYHFVARFNLANATNRE